MASDKMLPITSEQPTESGLDVLTMSNAEIKNQISPTHVPPEKDFDANSLFVAVKRILKRFDNIFQDQKDLEILEEEASTDSLDPILGTVEQLSLEMTHKALDVEMAHRTTMSMLNKLSSYSWQTKAVLALANFALDYKKYILATSRGDPSTGLIESVEIPAYVTTFYHKEEIKKMINRMLSTTECILDLEKQKSSSSNDAEDVSLLSHAMDDIPVVVYWIIMSVVACTTPVFCPTSNEDNTQELLSLATSIYDNLVLESWNITRCPYDIEDRKAMRRMKEFLQTPDEVTEVLKRLLFGKDDVQPLIDSCLDERKNLLHRIQMEGTREAFVLRPTGPHMIEDYNFYCGGKDNRWIEQFSEKVNAMAEDPIIKEALISVECSCVEKVNTWNPFQKAPKTRKRNEEIQRILPSFKNEKRWAVLIKWSTKIVSDDGPTILKVLEMFDEWKQYVSERGFENCFREYHEKLRSTSPNPSTSQPV